MALPAPARAFDLFGLFGGEEEPPAPSAAALPYTMRITGVDDSDVLTALQDTSTLYRLRQEAPPDGEGLVRRAEADLRRLVDALSGYGYYQGTVSIRIDGVAVTGESSVAAAARAAEASRNRALVPVKIAVDPGPLYTLRSVKARDASGRPFPEEVLPERFTRVDDDVPARSATVLAREARIVDRFRALGHPFAKAVARDPVVDDAGHVMDVGFTIEPGPVAGIGEVAVHGAEGIDPAVIRSFIYTEPGDPYAPKAVAELRRTLAKVEGLGSIRVREGEALDAQGNLPLFVELGERERNLIGLSARYSTVDGPGVRAYYSNRNLFGGGETFRIDADLYYLGLGFDPYAQQRKAAGIGTNGLGGRVSATFVKPALWGTRNDFLANVFAAREVQQSYFVDAAGASAAIRHRFSDSFSAQIGIDGQFGRSKDALGTVDYRLIGVPISVTYDSTDSLLDPTEGVRLMASVAPYPGFMGSDPGIVVAKAQGSTYYSLDDESRYILAGRIGLGSVSGAGLAEIPDNFRFFAGGGGSVRGFPFRTLGPRGPFNLPIGGRSLFEASLEARIKVTDTIGVVPFFDAGTAFASPVPDFSERIRKAAGIGLRYYTGIGPVRVDLAFPLDHVKGNHERPVVLYISLGQAF
ncbi:BamA/TamA family outer membrane protein [Methylobacterium organophilum]|uniref:autotransporter assembly complex protein TamA n=1 Tax=Methylobacterium organophilum TaxID=410 RepID=UPI001F13618A|nr:BamA/TamA family outer membrane protein [Methylobacterium organophilum]UMY17471.1 BamA/TamA family outer membrane protein [Methylobacterium organophilum]